MKLQKKKLLVSSDSSSVFTSLKFLPLSIGVFLNFEDLGMTTGIPTVICLPTDISPLFRTRPAFGGIFITILKYSLSLDSASLQGQGNIADRTAREVTCKAIKQPPLFSLAKCKKDAKLAIITNCTDCWRVGTRQTSYCPSEGTTQTHLHSQGSNPAYCPKQYVHCFALGNSPICRVCWTGDKFQSTSFSIDQLWAHRLALRVELEEATLSEILKILDTVST